MQSINARFRLVILFFNPIAYMVSITHGRCRALFIFSGGKAYRMPGVYLPRITEPWRCRSTGERRRAKRETEGEKEREREERAKGGAATQRATVRKRISRKLEGNEEVLRSKIPQCSILRR